MNSLGIYFGPRAICLVETKGKKVINNIQIPQSTISPGELEEKVPGEVKTIEIIALIKDELRRSKIEAKEATLCLSGKDLIIRTFEIPAMPREELESAINFEAKKYIPFKVEDLVSDYQAEFEKASRTNLILFMGIKKDTLDRYISILSQLNIKIRSIEYSAFSVLRALILSGSSDNGIVALIGADLKEEDEVNFTVLEKGFPLFSRDIALAATPEEAGKPQGVEAPALALEKLKSEIRVSLDYYHRKFPSKNIKKIFLISNPDSRSDLEAFMMELGLSVQFVDVTRNISGPVSYSLNFIKGYTASLSTTIRSNIKLNLLTAKERVKPLLKEKPFEREAVSLFEGLKLDFKMITLGLLICLATFGFGIYRMMPLRNEIKSIIIGMRTPTATVNPEATYEELASADSEYKRKLDTLDNLIENQLYLTKPLNVIPRAIPKGVWLTNFTFNKSQEKKELILEGMVYLADGNEEMKVVNQFLSSLKEDPELTKYFKDMSITSIDRRELGKLTVTNFFISCKTYKERE